MSIENKRIIYPTNDGGVAVVVPAPGVPLDIVMQDVPEGVFYQIIDKEDLPDRMFRAAWVFEE